jgi:hemerythrin
MKRYLWDDSIATGIPKIDEQNKTLFEAINNLEMVAETGKGEQEIKKSLDFLTDYTIKHFFEEEEIQKRHGYPEFESHHQEHEDFKASVRKLSHQLILKGTSVELVDSLSATFGDWLVTHIKIQDKKLAAYLREHGAA